MKYASCQSPEKFSYQAILRNAAGNLLANQSVGLKLSILEGAATVFAETHSTSTDANGLISVIVGNGTPVTGSIAAIDWGAGSFSVKAEADPAGGSSYTIIGSQDILSVPYALYSNISGSSTGGDYNNLINAPLIDGSETKLSAGSNVTITGSGTTAAPYVINTSVTPSGFTHYIGELYQGGIVVGVWREAGVEKGLIAGLTDIGNVAWSDVSLLIGASAQNHRYGQPNTTAILAQSATAPAAKLCNDYVNPDTGTGVYSDWYLPANWELMQCYRSALVVNRILGDANGFGSVTIWSSTEYLSTSALVYSYSNGYAYSNTKTLTSNVRPVRRF
ncbi:MAG: hypothetical protein MUE32_05585 [Bacteroidales bacterium]|nr:hypothetical protein [Bacteroidales bacterium]